MTIARAKTALYSCKHTREYAYSYCPEVGEEVMCIRCNKGVAVEVVGEGFIIKCDGCRYTRNFGLSRIAAECKASKHHSRYPTHEITLTLGNETLHRWKASPDMIFTLALQKTGDYLPF